MQNLTVAIAGSSGYIGKELQKNLTTEFNLICLQRRADAHISDNSKIEYRNLDLFSISSAQSALKGVDVAIYLIHSMLPSTRLFQGNFADTDLILADNFVRGCLINGVKQIIYLGGLIPQDDCLSPHLQSRKEVEGVLRASGIPVTVLRASMVVGLGGSSFSILQNLVENLPVMILPKWTKNSTQTIYIEDVQRVMASAIGNSDFFGKTIDLVNGEQLTYELLLRNTAKGFGLKRMFVPIPWNLTDISKRWVCLFGQADINLVSPLVDSLKVNLPNHKPVELIEKLVQHTSYLQMLEKVQEARRGKRANKNTFRRPLIEDNTVRSVQRLKPCQQLSGEQIANAYFKFLPQLFKAVVYVQVEGNQANFRLRGMKKPLLQLTHVAERSDKTRHLFYITGGWLVARKDYGWLEFRQIDHKKYTLAIIHEFKPSLPWYIYRMTQAPIHAWVMRKFGDFLDKNRCQA